MDSNDKVTTDTPYPECSDLSQVAGLLKEYGVCVIPDVFSSSECDSWMKEILTCIEKLSGGQVHNDHPDQWTVDKLPPQVRYGLYQNVLNNLKPVWEVRRNPRMKKIFKPVYSELRGEEVDDFVCSIDGINIQPNISKHLGKEKDWAHCDQTTRDDIYKCVQGQVVLTNTEACFRASPTSHKHFLEIMETCEIPDTDRNFVKFDDRQLEKIMRDIVSPNNVPFQIPIKAKKGSVILWFSTMVHSAMSSSRKEIKIIQTL